MFVWLFLLEQSGHESFLCWHFPVVPHSRHPFEVGHDDPEYLLQVLHADELPVQKWKQKKTRNLIPTHVEIPLHHLHPTKQLVEIATSEQFLHGSAIPTHSLKSPQNLQLGSTRAMNSLKDITLHFEQSGSLSPTQLPHSICLLLHVLSALQ